MAGGDIGALFAWGNGLANAAAGAGFPMQGLPASNELKDFVEWARSVAAAMGGMVPLPALAEDADYAAALGWARTLDGTARSMGADLPQLPAA